MKNFQKAVQVGLTPNALDPIPGRDARERGWWVGLTCDREVLARFDSRLRADADILRALNATLPDLNPIQISLIKAHFRSKNHTSTIPYLARMVKAKFPTAIRTAYQNAGKLICNHSEYEPPKSPSGSADWLTIIAHRVPSQNGRAVKWVMNNSFGKAAKKLGII